MSFSLIFSYFIEVDIGNVPWLFQDDFCDFACIHLGFNVSVQFMQVSLGKRVKLLILGVCAPLVVFFDAFLVITSASFLSGFVT